MHRDALIGDPLIGDPLIGASLIGDSLIGDSLIGDSLARDSLAGAKRRPDGLGYHDREPFTDTDLRLTRPSNCTYLVPRALFKPISIRE